MKSEDEVRSSPANPLLLVYVVIALCCLSLLAFHLYSELNHSRSEQVLLLQSQLKSAKKSSRNAIKWRLNDVSYFHRLFNTLMSPDDDRAREQQLLPMLTAFDQSREVYFQLRWLDAAGREQLRIDKNGDHYRRLADAELQDKSGRDYFVQAMRLPPGTPFISALDLNVEHGEVELPHRPTIRVGVRVADQAGNDRGMLILNYDANDLLQRFMRQQNSFWLTNAEGYWMYAADEQLLWGHSLQRPEITMAVRYPLAWRQIRKQQQGVLTTAEGVWVFDTLFDYGADGLMKHPHFDRVEPLDTAAYPWKMIGFISTERLQQMRQALLFNNLSLLVVVALVLLLFGFFLSYYLREYQSRQIAERARERLEQEVARRTLELDELNQELARQVRADPLTGLANRRAFEEQFLAEFLRTKRSAQTFSLMLIDVDNFKQINDEYGHETGDEILRHIADILQDSVRSTDCVARWGGEEFVVMLPDTGHQATYVAEKIRSRIEQYQFPAVGQVTVSIGVSCGQPDTEERGHIFSAADEAMYSAKKSGKNQVFYKE